MKPRMGRIIRCGISYVAGVATGSATVRAVLFLGLLCTPPVAGASDSVLKSMEFCNGAGHDLPAQIKGCSDLIASAAPTSAGLAIAYNNRGNAYVKERRLDLAISDYDQALVLNPRYVRAYNNRGIAFELKGDHDVAIANYNAAIALDPGYAVAITSRAEALAKQGNDTQAAADYDTALRLQPTLAAAWNGQCLLKARAGDLADALADCNRSIQIAATAESFDSRGFVHLQGKQWAEAISDYNAALAKNAELASALYGRGLAKIGEGDRKAGTLDLNAAKSIDPAVASTFE